MNLQPCAAPAFLRDFISRVWSRVLLRVAEQGGADGLLAQRLRRAGRELFLSVQPKPTPTHRKTFLAELPKLMQEINEGMNLIGWPEAQRRAFFGQLMPAHAEALKSQAGRQLDINMMARQIEGALERPLPSSADLKAAAAPLPVLTDEIKAPSFSADEAQRVGLVDESAVDWDGQVDIEIGTDEEAEGAEAGVAIPGLPSPGEPPRLAEAREKLRTPCRCAHREALMPFPGSILRLEGPRRPVSQQLLALHLERRSRSAVADARPCMHQRR